MGEYSLLYIDLMNVILFFFVFVFLGNKFTFEGIPVGIGKLLNLVSEFCLVNTQLNYPRVTICLLFFFLYYR